MNPLLALSVCLVCLGLESCHVTSRVLFCFIEPTGKQLKTYLLKVVNFLNIFVFLIANKLLELYLGEL